MNQIHPRPLNHQVTSQRPPDRQLLPNPPPHLPPASAPNPQFQPLCLIRQPLPSPRRDGTDLTLVHRAPSYTTAPTRTTTLLFPPPVLPVLRGRVRDGGLPSV